MQQDGQQISATNIVVLRAGVRYKFHDDPETLLAGTDHGTGYVAAGGNYLGDPVVEGGSLGTRSTSRRSSGAPVSLVPGNTWVELLPASGTGESQVLSFDSNVITTGR